ncbi:hypothetical protein BDZ88DRAFT_84347 [Geranomyces variabilis]|nr:hypothetical protein BDZ88DRAFT_84347 [Geranomyces variabilis]
MSGFNSLANVRSRRRSSRCFSEAATLERSLRELDKTRTALARQQRLGQPPPELLALRQQSHEHRICLQKTLQDIVLLDPTFAAGKGVDDKIWGLVFYPRIEELRSELRRAQKDGVESGELLSELHSHISNAMTFYHTMVLWLSSNCEGNLVDWSVDLYKDRKLADDTTLQNTQTVLLTLLQKSLICLGDLSRYKEMYALDARPKRWHVARSYYIQAARLIPDNGKPYSQLAILATYPKTHFDMLYWYCLSLVNTVPHSATRANIAAFYACNVSSPLAESSLGPLQQLADEILLLHRLTFKTEEATAGNLLVHVEAISRFIKERSADDGLSTLLSKAVPILISSYYDIDQMFENAEHSALRHAMRISQIFLTAAIFIISANSLTLSLPYLNETCLEPDGEHAALKNLAAASTAAVWLETSLGVFGLWAKYAGTFKEGVDVLIPIFNETIAVIAAFTNTVSSFADMDGSTECIPDDRDLLGFSPLRKYFATLTAGSIQAVLDPAMPTAATTTTMTRIARIASFSKRLADEPSIDQLRFDATTGRFVVSDGRPARGGGKLMKALATERLKDQVTALEHGLATLKRRTRRPLTVAFDAGCYVSATARVRRWICGGQCAVVVPLAVIDDLDALKKGSAEKNARAREAIRFLEQRFRYRSPYLRAQAGNETSVPWNEHTAEVGSTGVIVPREIMALIACLDWYRNEERRQALAKGEGEDGDFGFVFVTEDAEVGEVAAAAGISCMGLAEWERVLEQRRRDR